MANAWDNDPIVQSAADAPWANDEVIARAPWSSDPVIKTASTSSDNQSSPLSTDVVGDVMPVPTDDGTRASDIPGVRPLVDFGKKAYDTASALDTAYKKSLAEDPTGASANLGVAWALGAGAAQFAEFVGGAGYATGRAISAVRPGGNPVDEFTKGLKDAADAFAPLNEFISPQTDVGKAAMNVVNLLPDAMQAAGDVPYEAMSAPGNPQWVKDAAPAVGAVTQALTVLIGPKGDKAMPTTAEGVLKEASGSRVGSWLRDTGADDSTRADYVAAVGQELWRIDPEKAANWIRQSANDIKAGRPVDMSPDSLKFEAPYNDQVVEPGNVYESGDAGNSGAAIEGPGRQITAQEPIDTQPPRLPGPEDRLSGERGQPLDIGPENGPPSLSQDIARQGASDRASDIYAARDQFDTQRAPTDQGGEPPTPPPAATPETPSGADTSLVGGRGQQPDIGTGGIPSQFSGDLAPQNAVDRTSAPYAARGQLEAQLPLTADKIALDPSDPAGTISRIASAPVAPVRKMGEMRPMPDGVDPAQHAQSAGDLANALLHANSLEKGAKIAPRESREIMLKQAEDIRDASRNAFDQYRAQYGKDAADHLHQTAAAIFHQSKSKVKPAKPALVEAPSNKVYTVREHGSQGNNVVFSTSDKAAAQTKVHALLARDPSGNYSIETTNAVREPSAGGILQRQPSEVRVGGGERGQMEPGVKGQEAPLAGAEAQAQPQGRGNRGVGDVVSVAKYDRNGVAISPHERALPGTTPLAERITGLKSEPVNTVPSLSGQISATGSRGTLVSSIPTKGPRVVKPALLRPEARRAVTADIPPAVKRSFTASGLPLRKLTDIEQGAIGGAIHEMQRNGVSDSELSRIGSVLVTDLPAATGKPGAKYAHYTSPEGERVLLVDHGTMMNLAVGLKKEVQSAPHLLTHEIAHEKFDDSTGHLEAAIAREAEGVYNSTQDAALRDHLAYPFADNSITGVERTREAMAQLYSLWHADRSKFSEFPLAKRYFEERINDGTEQRAGEYASTGGAVQGNIRELPVSSPPSLPRGTAGVLRPPERSDLNGNGAGRSQDQLADNASPTGRGNTPLRVDQQGEPDYQSLTDEVGRSLDAERPKLGGKLSTVVSHLPPRKTGSVRERITDSIDAAKKLMVPASRGPLAGQVGDIIRHNLSQQAQDRERAYESLRGNLTRFIWKGKGETRAFIDAMEGGAGRSGPKLADPKMQKAAEEIGQLLDYRREQVRELGTGALENYYENYFPHIWKDPMAASAFFGKRPLEGSKNFLKQRKYADFSDAINAGLEPITENPVALALLKARDMDRFIYGQRIFQELKNEGIIKLLPWTGANGNRSRIPPGFEALNDKIARSPAGQWIAPEQAATVFNNHLSPGFSGKTIYDAIRATGNMLNAAQLGFSAFHLGFTTADAMISKGALGIMQISRGIARGEPMDIARGVGNYARGALNPAEPLINFWRGNQALNQYMGRAPHGFLPTKLNQALGRLPDAQLARRIEAGKRGGMRVYMDDFYRGAARDALMLAISDGKWGKAAMQVLPTVMDGVMWPIMQYLVPRQKLGVMMDMVQDQLRANPTMNMQEERAVMRKAWDSVDNRMGQLVYDNTFWNKMWKDVLMVAMRSVGWNFGDWRELPGGVVDLKNLEDIKRNGLSTRSAYILALATIPALWGAITQYLYTGKGPESIKDLYAPQTGKTRPDGSKDRVLFPTYNKDVMGYGNDLYDWAKYGGNPFNTVKNKLHPLVSTIMQLAENKDFFGGAIRIPGEGAGEQTADVGKYLAKQVLPFGVRNYQQQEKLSGEAPSVGGYVTSPSFYGITPAPGYITKDEGQAQTAAILRNKDAVITRLREDLRDGADPTETRQKALRFGLNKREIGQVMSAARAPRAPQPRRYGDQ